MKEITIIGERLNSSRKDVARALEQRDHSFIQREAQRQQENGAHYLDVNAGAFPEQEVELLSWLCEKVREVSPAPLCLDTTSPKAAEAALSRFSEKALLNGLTGEKPRLEAFVPLARSYGCGVIALCMDERGLPPDAEGALAVAHNIVEYLTKAGIALENIYLDAALRPISVDGEAGVRLLNAAALLKEHFLPAHIVAGLSNISFGLPARSWINRSFAVLALCHGVDTFILDPCDRKLMASLLSGQAVLNQDQYCRRFLAAYRGGRLGD